MAVNAAWYVFVEVGDPMNSDGPTMLVARGLGGSTLPSGLVMPFTMFGSGLPTMGMEATVEEFAGLTASEVTFEGDSTVLVPILVIDPTTAVTAPALGVEMAPGTGTTEASAALANATDNAIPMTTPATPPPTKMAIRHHVPCR